MRNEQSILEVLEAGQKRRAARRDFLRTAGMATAAAGGLAMLAACDNENGDADDRNTLPSTPTPTVNSIDVDILNFALNLEYLEAQYYSYAVYGTGLAAGQLTGVGTQGAVATSVTAGPRAVSFTGEPLIGQYAREIAFDEAAHVALLRTALGSAAVAQPAINLNGDATGAFTAAARAAGIATTTGTLAGTTSTTGTFDPYSSPDAFLIGAFIFEDVGVTAYKGAIASLVSKIYVEAAAGIHAAEAYHAGIVRSVLYNRGQSNAGLINAAGRISDARDVLDGAPPVPPVTTPPTPPVSPIPFERDEPITTGTAANNYAGDANIVPADADAIAYSRTPALVLRIAYLTSTAGATSGGFFPAGVNGNIRNA